MNKCSVSEVFFIEVGSSLELGSAVDLTGLGGRKLLLLFHVFVLALLSGVVTSYGKTLLVSLC